MDRDEIIGHDEIIFCLDIVCGHDATVVELVEWRAVELEVSGSNP